MSLVACPQKRNGLRDGSPYAIRTVLVRILRWLVSLDRSRFVPYEFVDCKTLRRFAYSIQRGANLLHHDGDCCNRDSANDASERAMLAAAHSEFGNHGSGCDFSPLPL
jgi:hypothetical protein